VSAGSPNRHEYLRPHRQTVGRREPGPSAGRIAEIVGETDFTAGGRSGVTCPAHVLRAVFTGRPARASASGAADREATKGEIRPYSAGAAGIGTIAVRTSFNGGTSDAGATGILGSTAGAAFVCSRPASTAGCRRSLGSRAAGEPDTDRNPARISQKNQYGGFVAGWSGHSTRCTTGKRKYLWDCPALTILSS